MRYLSELRELKEAGVKKMLGGLPAGLSFREFEEQVTPWVLANLRRRRGRGGGGGDGGGIAGWLTGLIVVLFLAYVAMTMVTTFDPLIGNLSYGGGGVGATIFSLVQDWILPMALIGLLLYVVFSFIGKKRG